MYGPGCDVAPPDRCQHTDDTADHLPDEMRALDPDQDQRIAVGNLQLVDEDDGGFFHGIVVGEAAEVPHADERRCGVAHQADIEGLADPPDERFAKRRPASGDLVEIAAADGIVPGGATTPLQRCADYRISGIR